MHSVHICFYVKPVLKTSLKIMTRGVKFHIVLQDCTQRRDSLKVPVLSNEIGQKSYKWKYSTRLLNIYSSTSMKMP